MGVNKIEKIREDLYVRKFWDGYKVVYPNRKDLEKPFSLSNANWRNILMGGRWTYILKLIIILLIIYAFVYMQLANEKQCRTFASNFTNICIQYYSEVVLKNNTIQDNSYLTINDLNNLNFTLANETS
jgi:hypothetical protein